MKITNYVAAALLLTSGSLFAQTCDSPYTGLESHTPLVASTCGGQIGIDLGGAIYPHPSHISSFVWEDGSPAVMTLEGTNMEFGIMSNCSSAAHAVGAPGIPIDLETIGLVDGNTYLVIVSTDPGIDPTDPPTCGDFTLNPQHLPVELQSFSID